MSIPEEVRREGEAEEAEARPPGVAFNPRIDGYIARLKEYATVWRNHYLAAWNESRFDKTLRKLAEDYHDGCEAYDRLHCEHRNRRGIAVPMYSHEIAKVSRHASLLRMELGRMAADAGATPEQWRRAIVAEAARRQREER